MNLKNKLLSLFNRKTSVALLLGSFCLSTAVAMPTIQTWRTKTGTPVYLIQTNSVPMLLVELLFNAGSAYDQTNHGLASLTNSLFGLGTTKLSEQDIANGFAEQGADFSMDVGKSFATLNLRCLSSPASLAKVVPLFHQVITQLKFSDDSFQRVKSQLLAGIKSQQQDPGEVAKQAFFKALYGGSPYAHPTAGTLTSVNALTKKQALNFYHNYYTQRNLSVLLVGDVDRTKAMVLAQHLTSGLPIGKSHHLAIKAKPAKKPRVVKVNFPTNQAAVRLGMLSAPVRSPEQYALTIGNQILGGSGLTSLLAQQVRERYSLSYAVGSLFIPAFGLQPFMVGLQTKTASVQKAIHVAKQTMARFLSQGPSKQALKEAKDYLIGSFPLGLDSNAKLMSVLTYLVQFHYPLNYLKTYRQHIAAVTVSQVKSAMNHYLSVNKLVTVVVSQGKQDA